MSFYGFDVSAGNVETIRQTVITKYGKPKKTEPLVLRINPNARAGTEYTWVIGNVTIFLHINDIKNESSLFYTYDPIYKLMILDEKKGTKKMEKDL